MFWETIILFFGIIAFFILFLFSFFGTSVTNLVIGECVWILIFTLVVLSGFTMNLIPLLSLSLFILVLSSLEFGMGMLLLTLIREGGCSGPITNKDFNAPMRDGSFNQFLI